MNIIEKQRIRKIVIFSILGLCVLAALLRLKIEPADYGKNPSSQTELSVSSVESGYSESTEYAVSSVVTSSDGKKEEKTESKLSSATVSQGKENVPASSVVVASSGGIAVSSEKASSKKYCTIEIRCDTVTNTEKLTNQAVAKYIPKNGTILAETRVEIADGETAFEVLKRVTRQEGIQMEFRNDPVYSGAYIEGINHLYEFDGGAGSGWMYKVNGWFPNYGCARYQMKDGDKMVWCYTCNIGKDVGDQYYDTHPDANPEYS